jgi:hypothetical protein
MAQVAKRAPHILVDGKLFPCTPAGEFGFLGERILCDLGKRAGHPTKKLLLRRVADGSGRRTNDTLEVRKLPGAGSDSFRPILVKKYEYATPTSDGKLRRDELEFIQQDVSGLMTLREAVLKVVGEGSPRKVWFLFYSACKSLNSFGKSAGAQGPVLLQCPNSLAVDARTGDVVVLDAELRLHASGTVAPELLKWFGQSSHAG